MPLKSVWLKLLLISLFGLAGCERQAARNNYSLSAFGTIIDVAIYGDQQRADLVIIELEQQLLDQHNHWHAWQSEGALSKINRAFKDGRTADAVSRDLRHLIRLGQEYEIASNGRFNPAIGKLIGLWGFHGKKTPRPNAAQIKHIADSKPSMSNISLDGTQARSDNPHVQLDMGGYAKGYAVELGLNLLRKHGFNNAMINAGGDLKAIGKAGIRPWHIGIRDPADTTKILATMDIKPGEAVFTSGSYLRRFEDHHNDRHHILDPKNARPSRHWRSATVVDHDATLADAAATALMVSKPNDWRELATNMGVSQVLLISNDGQAIVTPELEGRLQWPD